MLSEYGGTYYVMDPTRQNVVGRVKTAREAVDLVLESPPED